jgi:hypothetical protein
MSKPSIRDLVQMAHEAGYYVESTEQLRANRWLLALRDEAGAATLVLVQARPLISAADVQDLAEIARLRQPDQSVLLAYGGSFSPAAQRTLTELADGRLRLCTVLPRAPQSGDEARQARPALRPTN